MEPFCVWFLLLSFQLPHLIELLKRMSENFRLDLSMTYLHFFDEFASSSTCFSGRLLPPLLKLGDGREADPGERRRAQSRARRDPEEEKKEGHHVVLLLLHGSDHCGVHPAYDGAGRKQPRHRAAGGGWKLDGGTGNPTDWFITNAWGLFIVDVKMALETWRILIRCVFLASQVKAQVWLKAVTLNLCHDFYQRFSPDHCILLYQKKGNVCEIYDKHQVFQTLDCIRYWRGTN